MENNNVGFKKSVFISHASKNFKLADELRKLLEDRGISCWIAPRDIPPGYQYGTAIIEAIRECSVTLLVLTDDANQSKAVENEIERAFGYQKVIIPIRIRDIKPATGLEFFISNAQWVDAIKSPLKTRVDQIANIVHAIELKKPIPTPAPEKRTIGGTIERFLEQALRHKMISAVSAFLILATLGAAGLYMQSRAHLDLSGIDAKLDKVKLETSSDPRKELANLGVQWSEEQFKAALISCDWKVVNLFLQGGLKPNLYAGANQNYFIHLVHDTTPSCRTDAFKFLVDQKLIQADRKFRIYVAGDFQHPDGEVPWAEAREITNLRNRFLAEGFKRQPSYVAEATPIALAIWEKDESLAKYLISKGATCSGPLLLDAEYPDMPTYSPAAEAAKLNNQSQPSYLKECH